MKWRVLILLICWGVVGAAGRADGADDDGREIELDVNDVSFLWPPPRDRNDLASLISADDALADEDASFWPESAFKAVLEKAQNTAVVNSAGRENRISFRPCRRVVKAPPHRPASASWVEALPPSRPAPKHPPRPYDQALCRRDPLAPVHHPERAAQRLPGCRHGPSHRRRFPPPEALTAVK